MWLVPNIVGIALFASEGVYIKRNHVPGVIWNQCCESNVTNACLNKKPHDYNAVPLVFLARAVRSTVSVPLAVLPHRYVRTRNGAPSAMDLLVIVLTVLPVMSVMLGCIVSWVTYMKGNSCRNPREPPLSLVREHLPRDYYTVLSLMTIPLVIGVAFVSKLLSELVGALVTAWRAELKVLLPPAEEEPKTKPE